MSSKLQTTLVLILIVLAVAGGIAWWLKLPFWLVLGGAAVIVVVGAIWNVFG